MKSSKLLAVFQLLIAIPIMAIPCLDDDVIRVHDGVEVSVRILYTYRADDGTFVYPIRVYLRNIGDKTIRLPLGRSFESQELTDPIGAFVFEGQFTSEFSEHGSKADNLIRYPENYYNIVSLQPGEVTALPPRLIRRENREDVRIWVVYYVSEKFADFYNVWHGNLCDYGEHIEADVD